MQYFYKALPQGRLALVLVFDLEYHRLKLAQEKRKYLQWQFGNWVEDDCDGQPFFTSEVSLKTFMEKNVLYHAFGLNR